MGMVFCRGCGKDIHETAITCPHCGAVQIVQEVVVELSAGTVVAGYLLAVFIPIAGLVFGIVSLVKKNSPHAIGILILSILFGFFWIAIL